MRNVICEAWWGMVLILAIVSTTVTCRRAFAEAQIVPEPQHSEIAEFVWDVSDYYLAEGRDVRAFFWQRTDPGPEPIVHLTWHVWCSRQETQIDERISPWLDVYFNDDGSISNQRELYEVVDAMVSRCPLIKPSDML